MITGFITAEGKTIITFLFFFINQPTFLSLLLSVHESSFFACLFCKNIFMMISLLLLVFDCLLKSHFPILLIVSHIQKRLFMSRNFGSYLLSPIYFTKACMCMPYRTGLKFFPRSFLMPCLVCNSVVRKKLDHHHVHTRNIKKKYLFTLLSTGLLSLL